MTQIQPIHTSCKNCVFAIYDKSNQSGCSLNYLEIYKNNNVDILEAYDDNKEFYILNNKKCVGYRELNWFDQFDEPSDTIEQKKKLFYSLNKLHYLLVVDLRNLKLTDLEDIIKDINSQDIKPQKMILVRYQDESLEFAYDKIELILKDNISYPWRIQTMLDNDIPYDNTLHNITMINPNYRFIMSVNKYSNDILKIINHTNQLVYHDLKSFNIISNTDKSCFLYSGSTYRFSAVVNKQNILADSENYSVI